MLAGAHARAWSSRASTSSASHAAPSRARLPPARRAVPAALADGGPRPARTRPRRACSYVAMTRARDELVLSRPAATEEGNARPSPLYEDARAVLDAGEQEQGEELFGPAEGLQATYRLIQDEVLEEAWRAGGKLARAASRHRTLTSTRAVARFLELVKLAGLIQGSGEEPVADALAAINDLLEHAISPEQRTALTTSGLDAYLLDEEGERRKRRRELIAAAATSPRSRHSCPGGARVSRSRPPTSTLYRTCPLKYKFARVFGDSAGDDDQPALRDRHPPGAGALPWTTSCGRVRRRRTARERLGQPRAPDGAVRGRPGGGPGSASPTTSFSSARRRSRRSAATTPARSRAARTPAGWSASSTSAIGPHHLRGRVDRVDQLPEWRLRADRLQDRRPEAGARARVATCSSRSTGWRPGRPGASRARPAATGTCSPTRRSPSAALPTTCERVEGVVLEVGEGILGQDFEPRPSPEICSWCDFRLICPASEA